MSNLICPKCGKTSDKAEFIESFCISCYPDKIKVPGKMEYEICTRCERIRMGGVWVAFKQEKLNNEILSKCKGNFESAQYDFKLQLAKFTLAGGKVIEREILSDLKKTICRECSHMSGGYYEGIIQLRGRQKKAEEYAEIIMAKLEGKTFIAKAEEKDGGLDIYVGSSKVVLRIVVDLGLDTLITKKLIGRDQGKRLYRTTFRVRL